MNSFFSASLVPYAPPSLDYLLGSDSLGRSYLLLLLKSTGLTILDVGAAATLALLVATFVAIFGSIFRGTIGRFVFGLASTFSFSTPLIAVLLLLYSVLGDSPAVFPLAVGGLLWGSAALTMQTAISQEWRSSYIKAARALGMTSFCLVFKHLLPNLVSPMRSAWIANWPTILSTSILAAYLGANSNSSPRLGSLIKTGYDVFPACWWLWLPPTIVTSFAFIGVYLCLQRFLTGGSK